MKYSDSYIQRYKDCPLSCYLNYEARLDKTEDETSEHHLKHSAAFHEALAHLYKGDTMEAAKSAFNRLYPVQLDPLDMAKTIPNAMTTLELYAKRWAEEDKKWKVIAVEEKDSFDYEQADAFTVKLDLVMENKAFGGIYGFDHKMTGGKKAYLSYEFWNQFEPNSQLTKYYSYIQSKYGDCSGFYVNGIGLGYRQRAYKGEPAGFWCKFERQMFNRNQSQLDFERNDTSWWIKRIEESRASGVWGANSRSCFYCKFRPICAAGWQWPQDEELILIQYKQRPIVAKGEKDESVRTGVQGTP